MITMRETSNCYVVNYINDGDIIGRLTVSKDKNAAKIAITGWYVNSSHQHQGIGKALLKELFANICVDNIKQIEYIWNGANAYVGEWLKKFNAVSHCPLNVLKTLGEDTWESHIYTLDREKFLSYVKSL